MKIMHYLMIGCCMVFIISIVLLLIISVNGWPRWLDGRHNSSSRTLEDEIMEIWPDSNKLYEEGLFRKIMDKKNKIPLIIPKSHIHYNINGIYVRIIVKHLFVLHLKRRSDLFKNNWRLLKQYYSHTKRTELFMEGYDSPPNRFELSDIFSGGPKQVPHANINESFYEGYIVGSQRSWVNLYVNTENGTFIGSIHELHGEYYVVPPTNPWTELDSTHPCAIYKAQKYEKPLRATEKETNFDKALQLKDGASVCGLKLIFYEDIVSQLEFTEKLEKFKCKEWLPSKMCKEFETETYNTKKNLIEWNDKIILMTLIASELGQIFKNRIITSVTDSASFNITLKIEEIEIRQYDHDIFENTMEVFRHEHNRHINKSSRNYCAQIAFPFLHFDPIMDPKVENRTAKDYIESPYQASFEDASICNDKSNTLFIKVARGIHFVGRKVGRRHFERYDVIYRSAAYGVSHIFSLISQKDCDDSNKAFLEKTVCQNGMFKGITRRGECLKKRPLYFSVPSDLRGKVTPK